MVRERQPSEELEQGVSGKIDQDLAERSWDGVWGNPLCFVLTAVTTRLAWRHPRLMLFAGLFFFVLAAARLALLVWRQEISHIRHLLWRRLAVGLVIGNGTGWGLLGAYLSAVDGYHDPDVMVLLLYLSAVAAAGASFLVHNAVLIRVYVCLLYGPQVTALLWSSTPGHWGSALAFALYSLFLVVHGGRMHKEYFSRVVDNHTLSRIAKHDFLTGLPNRFSLVQLLESGLARARREKLVLLYVDLNGFKGINDRLSHRVGDLFLCAVARRMEKAAGPGAVVGRLGGDEFLIFLSGLRGQDEAERRAGEILRSLQAVFPVETHQLRGDASIGISMYPDHGELPGDLVRHADQAMYVAKRLGGHRYAFACGKLPDDSQVGVTLAGWSAALAGNETEAEVGVES